MSESDTPKVKRGDITRRNLLAALTGSKPDDQVSTPSPCLKVAVQNQGPHGQVPNTEPSFSIAYQKKVQQQNMNKQKLAKTLENLFDRRDLITEKMLRIQDAMGSRAEKNVHFLNLQLETVRKCYDEYESLHAEISSLVPKEDKVELKTDYLAFEQIHAELYVKIQTLLSDSQRSEASKTLALNANASEFLPRQQVVNTVPHLQVPLPTFDGKLENWYSFKCMFQTIMSRYPNESPAIKLYHLKNSLIGSAAGKIDQDVINNNDYDSAWRLLQDAYEDQRLIIDTHIDALLELPKMTKENGDEMRKLVETCTKHIDALKNLAMPVEGLSEMILINVISKRLDRETRKQWESTLSQDELPTFADLIDFLKERSRVLQKLGGHQQQPQHQAAAKPRQAKVFMQTAKETCPSCSASHTIYKCDAFRKLPVSARFEKVKKAGLCFNCLRQGHRTIECKTEQGCRNCSKRHHSLLHQNQERSDSARPAEQQQSAPPTAEEEKKREDTVPHRVVNCCTQTPVVQSKQIFLSTVKVVVSGSGNSRTTCKALLDCCSESNVITERLAAKLNMKTVGVNPPIVICGLNGMKTTTDKICQTKISSRDGEFSMVLDFLVTPSITELPTSKVETSYWPLPPTFELADPTFDIPDHVDMIIGAEVFYDILKQGRVKIGRDLPILAETVFGWVVSGPVKTSSVAQKRICQLTTTQEEINRTLTKFWELEACSGASKMTAVEQAVERHFDETHSRSSDGRYIVRLPFNDLRDQLGDSFENALRRLGKLQVSFAKNPCKRNSYAVFMQEYQALGHMKEVHDEPERCYFLPHHAVYKETSSTTKIRVVFDASAATNTGISLNDTQLVGPTVQSDLVSIITRFCVHPVVLTADIPKMYRQVQIHKDDRKFQRILWMNDEGKVVPFELTTVTYGCSSAPYLATKALLQLADDEGNKFPLAARVIKEDSYIDDFLTGGKTVEEVAETYRQLQQLLALGGFGVHKFCSNSEEILKNIPAELQEKRMNFETSEINNTIKTLGLVWNPEEDYFVFNVPPLDASAKLTKRTVLSEIGRLFDPLGFLGPVVTTAKLTMQELWRLQLNWEDELPEEQKSVWLAFRQQLVAVRSIRKKRCVIPKNTKRVELHGFCDASRRAYGGCLYVKSETDDGVISVRLMCSKSRVAPLKPMTTPRLELCGALVLAELTRKVIQASKINFDSVNLWSDSQIVLNWLKRAPSSLNEFVCNRVASIVELTQNYEWRYIRTDCNPADALSRGLLPEQLLDDELWWTGPLLLRESPKEQLLLELLPDRELPEIRTAKVALVTTKKQPAIDLTRLSDFRRLRRAWVYVLRAFRKPIVTSPVTAEELTKATHTIYRLVQKESFQDLRKQLESGSTKRGEFFGLAPFLDSDGLIRVGGRLKYSDIPYTGKHQVLLPQNHQVTEMIIRYLHEKNHHVGHNGLLALVRQYLWPIRAMSVIKRVVSRCQRCCRQHPPQLSQYMGNLPSYRIVPSPVFAKTGLDFAGPFILKEGGRKPRFYKAYVCVFVCMAVKAVHMELVTDLRTETFLAAFRRFVGRYGVPGDLYSDNGTTFVGARNELAELRELFESQQHKNKLSAYCSAEGISWHFIPPRSPHFGGIWDAGVKSMKTLYKRVVGETKLTYEEMYTLLVEIEAILNSRPLGVQSDDPNDLEPLSPSHFLIGRPSRAIPEPSLSDEKVGKLSRWQHVQMMRDHFWNRWSTEYLHTLQTRQKWNRGVVDIREGALVLLREENIPPQQWKLGRIVSTHPGKDGVVRVVTVKTTTGEYQRAVAKICLLPGVESDESTGGE